jgi:hypothetical protein
MARVTGAALMTVSACGIVTAVYLLAGKGGAIFGASFILYVLGYHLFTKGRDLKAKVEPEEPVFTSSIGEARDEYRRKRSAGMN